MLITSSNVGKVKLSIIIEEYNNLKIYRYVKKKKNKI